MTFVLGNHFSGMWPVIILHNPAGLLDSHMSAAICINISLAAHIRPGFYMYHPEVARILIYESLPHERRRFALLCFANCVISNTFSGSPTTTILWTRRQRVPGTRGRGRAKCRYAAPIAPPVNAPSKEVLAEEIGDGVAISVRSAQTRFRRTPVLPSEVAYSRLESRVFPAPSPILMPIDSGRTLGPFRQFGKQYRENWLACIL